MGLELEDAGARGAERKAGWAECVAMGALFHGTGFITLARPREDGANTLLGWLSAGSLEKVTQSTHPRAGRTADGS